MNPVDSSAEWIEADGLGGFASGTVSGIRSRRYHGLLLTATTPPAGRVMLVNGFDAWIETPSGSFSLSSQRYAPDVVHSDGATRIESFEHEPWPKWRFRLSDDLAIEQECFVRPGASSVFLAWRVAHAGAETIRLFVRPFFSGRDFHSTHHENGAFRFEPEQDRERRVWRPYDGATSRRHFQQWPRQPSTDLVSAPSFTARKRRAGLDAIGRLRRAGHLRVQPHAQNLPCRCLPAEGHFLNHIESIETCYLHAPHHGASPAQQLCFPGKRAADAYLVRRSKATIIAGYPWSRRLGTRHLHRSHPRALQLQLRRPGGRARHSRAMGRGLGRDVAEPLPRPGRCAGV